LTYGKYSLTIRITTISLLLSWNGTVVMINAERVLDALGDPTRRLVFKRLRNGTRSVREIAQGMDVSRPAVSQHLKVLRAAGLVVIRAEGTRRLYGVDKRGIEGLRKWLDGFWDETLVAFKAAAERAAAKKRKPR
jgi:DNA-binding transcriptional ArsR family regulator